MSWRESSEYLVVVLPVLVLAEGPAVARRVAARARLLRLAAAVPATLGTNKLISRHLMQLIIIINDN